MGNNMKDKTLLKKLYVNIDSSEEVGDFNDDGDERPYSGYNHTVISVNSVGPCFFSEEGKGWKSHAIEDWDRDVDWENLKPVSVHLVLVRYSDGGTFGRTDGYFSPLWVSPSFDRVKQWVKDNEERITRRYSGYFARLEEIKHEIVNFVAPENVSCSSKDWWK